MELGQVLIEVIKDLEGVASLYNEYHCTVVLGCGDVKHEQEQKIVLGSASQFTERELTNEQVQVVLEFLSCDWLRRMTVLADELEDANEAVGCIFVERRERLNEMRRMTWQACSDSRVSD